ncbi:MAG: LysR substrate-binding domain-containing protein [Acidobacteriota bacterium]
MLDYNALAVFIRVVEAQSFTGAARALDMPTSTVSRKVSELEKSLQCRLLERSTRRLRLTDAGSEIFHQAREGLETIESGVRRLSERETRFGGLLRLAAPPSLSECLLAPVIEKFQRQHPDVEISCLVTERRIDFIADGVDIALRIDPDDRRRFVETPIVSYRHLLLASPAYLEEHGEPSGPAELEHHRTIAFAGWPVSNLWTATDGRIKRNVRLEPKVAINDYAGILAIARAGHGIAEAPVLCCLDDLQTGALVEVMRPWRLLPVTLLAVRLRRPYPSRLVEAFTTSLVEQARQLFPTLAVSPGK